jgi:hypothetical protein
MGDGISRAIYDLYGVTSVHSKEACDGSVRGAGVHSKEVCR